MEKTVWELNNLYVQIETITGMTACYKVIFTEESIYLLNQGGTGAKGIVDSIFNVLLHKLFRTPIETKRDEPKGTTPDEIIQNDSSSKKLRYDDIEKYEIKNLSIAWGGMKDMCLYTKSDNLKYEIYFPPQNIKQAESWFEKKCPNKKTAN